jgi:hypothetical protein
VVRSLSLDGDRRAQKSRHTRETAVTAFLSLHTGSDDAEAHKLTKISSNDMDASAQSRMTALARC